LGARLGITQRTIRVRVIHDLSGGGFSLPKLIPVNHKTTGDHLLLKRIEANLSKPEVALKQWFNDGRSELWNMTDRSKVRRAIFLDKLPDNF
jgi:hypothetical protein